MQCAPACLDPQKSKERLTDIAMLCASLNPTRFKALLHNPIALDINVKLPHNAERALPVLYRRWKNVENDLQELIYTYKNASNLAQKKDFETKLQAFRANMVFVWAFRFWQKCNPVGHHIILKNVVQEELGGYVASKLVGACCKKAHDFAIGMMDVFSAGGHDVQGLLAVSRACKTFWRHATLQKSSVGRALLMKADVPR